MVQGQDAIEAVSFLTSATARLRVLDHLRRGPATQADLQTALDLPQSTLARNLGKLRDSGWVVETDEDEPAAAGDEDGRASYRLTALGAAGVDDLEPVAARTSVLARLTAEPGAFPLGTFGFDLGRLAGASWRVSSETEPYAVANRVRTVLEGSSRIESIRPHPNPVYSDVLTRLGEDPDRTVVSVVPADSLDDTAPAGGGEEAMPAAGEEPAATAATAGPSRRAVDDAIEYATIVVDRERVLLTGGHRGGMPSVLVETADEAVLAWAVERFERVLAAATPVREVA